jgi:hypothetical protein
MSDNFVYAVRGELRGMARLNAATGSFATFASSPFGDHVGTPVVFERPDGNLLLHWGCVSCVVDVSSLTYSDAVVHTAASSSIYVWAAWDGVHAYLQSSRSESGWTEPRRDLVRVDPDTLVTTVIASTTDGTPPAGAEAIFAGVPYGPHFEFSGALAPAPPGLQLIGTISDGGGSGSVQFGMSPPASGLTVTETLSVDVPPWGWAVEHVPFDRVVTFHRSTTPPPAEVWRDYRNAAERPV